jgi:type I restriction enzyme, S subunit
MKSDNWSRVTIGSISRVVRGASPRPAGDPRYFDGSYMPWITVADVTGIGHPWLSSTKSKLTEAGSKLTRIIEPGTLLLTNSGATLGVPKISSIRAGANDGIAMLLDPEADTLFLYYWLSSQTKRMREVIAPGIGHPT